MLQNVLLLSYTLMLWLVLPFRRYFPAAEYPASERLMEHVDVFSRELDDYLSHTKPATIQEIDEGEKRLSTDTRWRGVLFRLWGNDVKLSADLFPETTRILADVPGVVTAMHSILAPGKSIRVHPGVFKGTVRVHVPIHIPDGDTGISVLFAKRGWTEGSALIFDESYPHWAWNHTDQPRTVMIVDLVRPMPWPWLDRVNAQVLRTVRRSPRVLTAIQRAEEYRPEEHAAEPVASW